MKKIKILLTILGLISSFSLGLANDPGDKVRSIFDELSYQEKVEITLELDMDRVFGNRRSTEEHPAIISFAGENGLLQEWNIKVNIRGKFRRTNCDNLPPLKLNFKKKELLEAGLAKFDDMKLVTQCVSDDQEAKQLVIREYLTYKLFNQLTDTSFRVQFLTINYKDSKTGEIITQTGFLIEDAAQLRNRINVKKTKEDVYNRPKGDYNSSNMKVVSVFQYMIGNPDWDFDKLHNLKVYEKNGEAFAIPYDFDFSGIVGAPYVRINTDLQITSNKERIYLGFERDVESLENTLSVFSSKKGVLISTIKNTKLLNRRNKREMIRYINSFFRTMEEINFKMEYVKPPTLG